MLDYTMRSANENKLASTRTSLSQDKNYLREFRSSVDEFSIQQIHLTLKSVSGDDEKDCSFLIPKSNSASILIVIESGDNNNNSELGGGGGCSFEVVGEKKNISEKNNRQLEVRAGLVYFIDADVDFMINVGSMKASK